MISRHRPRGVFASSRQPNDDQAKGDEHVNEQLPDLSRPASNLLNARGHQLPLLPFGHVVIAINVVAKHRQPAGIRFLVEPSIPPADLCFLDKRFALPDLVLDLVKTA